MKPILHTHNIITTYFIQISVLMKYPWANISTQMQKRIICKRKENIQHDTLISVAYEKIHHVSAILCMKSRMKPFILMFMYNQYPLRYWTWVALFKYDIISHTSSLPKSRWPKIISTSISYWVIITPLVLMNLTTCEFKAAFIKLLQNTSSILDTNRSNQSLIKRGSLFITIILNVIELDKIKSSKFHQYLVRALVSQSIYTLANPISLLICLY